MGGADHLIVFLRKPMLGRVKTRLAAAVGDGEALRIYKELVSITLNAAAQSDGERRLFWTGDGMDGSLADDARFTHFAQQGNDLGERMAAAVAVSFAEGAQKTVIIGSDCPTMSADLIRQAYDALDTHDAVIGPASDGGYYLLGMRQLHPDFFRGKEWSTASVLTATLDDAKRLGLSFFLLEEMSDLDNVDDLRRSHLR
jgi:rSAM/selenodomain-associated transferase 1